MQNSYRLRTYKNEGLLHLMKGVPPNARRVLDVGCGSGDNARHLRRHDRELHGLTLSEQEAKIAAPYFDQITIANVETWIPNYANGYFDCIVLSHVLEHLIDPLCCLEKLKKLLSPNGTLCVAVPNILFWRQRLQFLLGHFDYTDEGILDRTHLRFFTSKSLIELVEQAGFVVVEKSVVGHFPFGPMRTLSPEFFRKADEILCHCFPGLFGFHLLCLGRPSNP